MSKELTPLEAFYKIANTHQYAFQEVYKKETKLIETALKDLEELKTENAVLNYWLKGITYYIENGSFTLLDLSKRIKAFEIIKECFVLNGFDELIPNAKWFENKEMQVLLKEVLK